MDERDVLAVDITQFFPLSDVSRIDRVQNEVRRIISVLKAYFGSISQDVNGFSNEQFEQSIKEIDIAQDIYQKSRRMETQRQLEVSSVEIALNQLCIQISDYINRLASIEQCFIQNNVMISQYKMESDSLEMSVLSLAEQISSQEILQQQLVSHNTALTESLKQKEQNPDHIADIKKTNASISSLDAKVKEIEMSIHSLSSHISTIKKAIADTEKEQEDQRARNGDKTTEFNHENEKIIGQLSSSSVRLKEQEQNLKAKELWHQEILSKCEEIKSRTSVKEADTAEVIERQKREMSKGADLERQTRELRETLQETRAHVMRQRDASSRRSDDVTSRMCEVQNKRQSVLSEISSIKRRFVAQKQARAQEERSIDILCELKGIRVHILDRFSELEETDNEYEHLMKRDVEIGGIDGVNLLRTKHESICDAIRDVIENEKSSGATIERMIAVATAKNEAAKSRIDDMRASVERILHINKALYDLESDAAGANDVAMDLKRRNERRIATKSLMNEQIETAEYRIDITSRGFDVRRGTLAHKHDALDDYNLQLEVARSGAMDANAEQGLALAKLVAFMKSVQAQQLRWQTTADYKIGSLMDSWQGYVGFSNHELSRLMYSRSETM